ncbi:hypothetical protein Vafri_5158 [Volvox africanus]|uniref:N-acetyltransferase domain-containing protein n=1 Tax=Volvox africanus TaxID=51714 RepID=A0A8J4AWW2_9CHLO|nr:hypothetical protein Vafri_5158 [Volvox africanus]
MQPVPRTARQVGARASTRRTCSRVGPIWFSSANWCFRPQADSRMAIYLLQHNRNHNQQSWSWTPIESLLPAAMASEPKAEEVEPAIIVTPQETVRQAAAIGNYSRPRPPAAEDLAAAAAAPRHLDPAEAGAEELSELAAAAAFQQPRAAEADRFSRVDVVGPVVALAAGCEVVGEVSLTNLAVVASMRGTGLGRRILVELLTRLGGERCPVFLEVRKDNTVAQALYDKLGFTTVGLRKRYNPDGSDSLVMTRQPGRLPAVASKPP